MRLYEHPDFEQAILRAADQFRPAGVIAPGAFDAPDPLEFSRKNISVAAWDFSSEQECPLFDRRLIFSLSLSR